jgi:cation:H+ antiporter
MTWTTVLFQVLLLAAAVAGLGIGARLLVDSASSLARGIGLSEFTVGLTVVAVGTSVPELIVTVDAALVGYGDIAVANVFGSNIYNIAFIVGVLSLIRVIPVERSLLHRDGVALIVSTVVGVWAVSDLRIDRIEGVLMVSLFVAYTVLLFATGGETATGEDTGQRSAEEIAESTEEDAEQSESRGEWRVRDGVYVIAGLAVVLVSGHLLVETAVELARAAGVSDWVIGGTVVAAGTSTPEFAVSLIALRRGRLGVSVGNVVGSNVFNLLGALGVAAIIEPLAAGPAAVETAAWLLVIVVAFTAALWTRRRLSRAEGGLFAASEILRWVLGLSGIVG